MHRCHFCGKILQELPYKCRRCGHSFCSDHHLPENHQCSGHPHHTHTPHRRYCSNCGKDLCGLPFRCNRCGSILCDDCRLPENHGCKVTYVPPDPPKYTPKVVKKVIQDKWGVFKTQINLRNFTIISLIFIGLSYLPYLYPLDNFRSTFETFFVIGFWCFFFAYFLYAVKCWGAEHQIAALLMVTIPLLGYFLATSKIPDSTTNILFYLFIQFCFYAILSAILLYLSNGVRAGIGKYILKKTWGSDRYFFPNSSYSAIGVIIVSIILISGGDFGILSDNASTISESLPTSNSYTSTTSPTIANPTQTYSKTSQVIPTLQPEIVKGIESTVGNSAPAIDIPTLEMQIHNGINQQRKNNGLSALSYDSSLVAIARKHSADMARNNYFSHDNLQGLDPSARGVQAGYSCYKNYGSYYTTGIAENIMQNNLYDSITYYNGIPRYAWNSQEDIAQSTVDGWMDSPGHRQNILTSTYDREGIGVAIASDDKVYITEDFC